MSSANSYQDQLQECLEFLKNEGFQDVHEALLDALYHRGEFGAPSEGTSSPAPLSEGHIPTEPVVSPSSLDALVPDVEQRGRRADLSSQVYGYADPGTLVPEHPAYPPRSLSPQQVPWEEGVNEYDTPEDVGYERRDVIGQRHFIELELDLASDAPDTGSLSQQQYSQGARTTTTYSQGARTNTTTTSQGGMSRGGDDSEDRDSSCGSSISGAVIELMPTSHSGACAQGISPGACSPSGASSSKARALDDVVWDMGPVGIRLAEPVTTPTKSNSVANADEPKPVLSRVESLSSSFKDFDIERNDDELPSRRTSGAQLSGPTSLSSTGAAPMPVDTIDFSLTPTTSTAQPADGELEFITSAAPPPSQLVKEQDWDAGPSVPDLLKVAEVTEIPAAAAAAGTTAAAATSGAVAPVNQPGVGPQPESTVAVKQPTFPPLRLLPQASQQSLDGSCTQKDDDVRENVGGGFSFPVTPTVPGAPPDHRIFKSWPSVRSSCTSEVIAASDDDHVAADYADDDYLRSKPSSRSASQNLGDKHFATRTSLNEEEGSSKHGEFEGWSFAKAMQPAVSTGGHAGDGSREPSLDAAPAADGMQATSASCISEPSTSANYITCMPANLLHMATGTPPGTGAAAGATQPANMQAKQQQVEPATGSTAAASPHPPDSHSPKPSPKAAHMPKAQHVQIVTHASSPPVSSSGAPSSGAQDTEHRVSGTAIVPTLEMSDGRGSHVSSHPAMPDSSPPSPSAAAATASQGAAMPAASAADTEEQFHEALSGSEDEAEVHVHDDGLPYEADDELILEQAGALAWEEVHAHGHLSGQSQTRMLEPFAAPEERHYGWDPDYIYQKYDVLELRVFHRRHRTGFEETKDLPIHKDDLIAGRYQVTNFLGSAAFSRAVEAIDIKTHKHVCLKIIKNNKDYFDQSLDEIKLLRYVNHYDPEDKWGIVRLEDYFYYKEHLFLVCELLRANLYEYQKHRRDTGQDNYFTNARIQSIAKQVLRALYFIHSLNLIHSDLKPENILIKSFTRCTVKVIDLGSSCYVTDQLSSYVQSRSYRAPEVILGLPYDQKIDIWSLGCILAELSSGQVLFQNDSLSTLLARLEGILGPVPQWMLDKGRYSNRYYTRRGQLYEKSPQTGRFELLVPKKTSLRHRVPDADEGLLSFISYLLHIDPQKRPTAAEALQHPWLSVQYDGDFDDAASY